jgi:GTP-binding protein HflX
LDILIPYNAGWVLPYIYDNGRVLEKEFEENGTRVKALIESKKAYKIMDYKL